MCREVMKMTKKLYVLVISVILSALVGTGIGLYYVQGKKAAEPDNGSPSSGLKVQTASLEEELWHTDLIVQGTAQEQELSLQQEAEQRLF